VHNHHLDVGRVQDVGLSGADDATVLAWAASEGRLVVTHDGTTLIADAYGRARDCRCRA
jgi:predicted nuclease of predicted toxin-antitoxin system